MHYFLRALREAARSWPLLAAAMLCSAGVAALWGANIAALFPIIEVTLKGESLQSWNEDRIEVARKRAEEGRVERGQLETEIAAGNRTGKDLTWARSRVDTLKLNVAGDEAVVYSAERLAPWLERFFPTDAFQTVLMVVAFVVVSTFVKHVLLLSSTLLVTWVAMNISRNIRLKVFDKALELDRAQFMRHGSAGFMAQVTATSEMLANGITAVYGGGMAVVQDETRKFYAHLCVSQTSLVLFAVMLHTSNGLTAALCLWISSMLALAGLAFSIRALEARFGALSLREHHGYYEQVPGLAVCFLITGLASVGFPGTIGFVPMELLISGSVEQGLWVSGTLAVAAMLNGIAIMRAYFALFTGKRPTTSVSLQVTPVERVGIVIIVVVVFLGGWFSPGVVASRHGTADRLLDRRSSQGAVHPGR